jgi:hypothetical protein
MILTKLLKASLGQRFVQGGLALGLYTLGLVHAKLCFGVEKVIKDPEKLP